MITVERTFDYETIKRIVTHPQVYPFLSDDGSPPASEWQPTESETVYYVAASNHRGVVGVLIFTPHNSICYEGHSALLPSVWGHGPEIGKLAMRWMFENSPCRRLIGNAPSFNPRVLAYAKRSGMQPFGVNQKSFLKDGILYDQVVLGASKEDVCR